MADMVKKERSKERTLRITDEVMARFNTIKKEMQWTARYSIRDAD